MSWQQKFKKQIGSTPIQEIKQLRFNNLKVNKLPDDFIQQIAQCINLQTLSLNQCGIRSLENFQQMNSIIHLEYLDNFTTSKTLQQISKAFPNLEILIAGGNFLRELSDLDNLKSLQNLKVLNIMNGINKSDTEIRTYAFNILPSLEVLDEKDKNGQIYIKQKQDKDKEKEKEKKQLEVETETNMEQEQISSDEEIESAECSDDSNEEDESDSEDDDSDLSDLVEKKVKVK